MNSAFDAGQMAGRLRDAASQVLETMFFAGTAPVEEASPAVLDGPAVALRFHGAATGSLSLATDAATAAMLAENFYGMGAGADEAQNVVSELANMVCGNLLSHLDTQSIFCLDAPHPEPAEDWPLSGARALLQVESGLLALHFQFQSNGESAL